MRDTPTAEPSAFVRYRSLRRGAGRQRGEARQAAIRQTQRDRRAAMEAAAHTQLDAWFAAQDDSEELLWFWFNHFNVYWRKDAVGVLLGDYLERALRPNLQGRFRDLLGAVALHPAMLVYLDNERNAAGRINENQARELLELHTLGVQGGYSQRDVQELARVMTGFGVIAESGRVPAGARRDGDFVFDPQRHDDGRKQVLGLDLASTGPEEFGAVLDLLAVHPSTARHVSERLALFLLGDAARASTVDAAVNTWTRTQGDLAAVVRQLRTPADGAAPTAPTFKDPRRWVLTSLRLLGGGAVPGDSTLALRWLVALGQPMFGCRTPDGYALRGTDWLGAGALAQRFEVAREIVAALPLLFDPVPDPADTAARAAARPPFANAGPGSRRAWAQAASPGDRLALMLSSPEFMHWSAA